MRKPRRKPEPGLREKGKKLRPKSKLKRLKGLKLKRTGKPRRPLKKLRRQMLMHRRLTCRHRSTRWQSR